MKNILHPAVISGTEDYGWLKANFPFIFGDYFDTKRIGFGKLRLLNDGFTRLAIGFSKQTHPNYVDCKYSAGRSITT